MTTTFSQCDPLLRFFSYLKAKRVLDERARELMALAPADFEAARVIDATGLIVAPGLVDLAARLREPGHEHEGMLETELNAAAAGGVTSLACPPDTEPVLDEPGLVEMLKHRAKSHALAHVYPLGAVTRHLEGHLLSPLLDADSPEGFPFLALLVSGGDTQIMRGDGLGRYALLGETIDDAADIHIKMLRLHAPEEMGVSKDYIEN